MGLWSFNTISLFTTLITDTKTYNWFCIVTQGVTIMYCKGR